MALAEKGTCLPTLYEQEKASEAWRSCYTMPRLRGSIAVYGFLEVEADA